METTTTMNDSDKGSHTENKKKKQPKQKKKQLPIQHKSFVVFEQQHMRQHRYSDISVGNIQSYEIEINDVLCGRGTRYCSHAGNKMYHSLVKHFIPDYCTAMRKHDKTEISKAIVDAVYNATPPGRFLYPAAGGTWRDIGMSKAREKTSQLLREGVMIGLANYTTVYQKKKHDKRMKKNKAQLKDEQEERRNLSFGEKEKVGEKIKDSDDLSFGSAKEVTAAASAGQQDDSPNPNSAAESNAINITADEQGKVSSVASPTANENLTPLQRLFRNAEAAMVSCSPPLAPTAPSTDIDGVGGAAIVTPNGSLSEHLQNQKCASKPDPLPAQPGLEQRRPPSTNGVTLNKRPAPPYGLPLAKGMIEEPNIPQRCKKQKMPAPAEGNVQQKFQQDMFKQQQHCVNAMHQNSNSAGATTVQNNNPGATTMVQSDNNPSAKDLQQNIGPSPMLQNVNHTAIPQQSGHNPTAMLQSNNPSVAMHQEQNNNAGRMIQQNNNTSAATCKQNRNFGATILQPKSTNPSVTFHQNNAPSAMLKQNSNSGASFQQNNNPSSTMFQQNIIHPTAAIFQQNNNPFMAMPPPNVTQQMQMQHMQMQQMQMQQMRGANMAFPMNAAANQNNNFMFFNGSPSPAFPPIANANCFPPSIPTNFNGSNPVPSWSSNKGITSNPNNNTGNGNQINRSASNAIPPPTANAIAVPPPIPANPSAMKRNNNIPSKENMGSDNQISRSAPNASQQNQNTMKAKNILNAAQNQLQFNGLPLPKLPPMIANTANCLPPSFPTNFNGNNSATRRGNNGVINKQNNNSGSGNQVNGSAACNAIPTPANAIAVPPPIPANNFDNPGALKNNNIPSKQNAGIENQSSRSSPNESQQNQNTKKKSTHLERLKKEIDSWSIRPSRETLLELETIARLQDQKEELKKQSLQNSNEDGIACQTSNAARSF